MTDSAETTASSEPAVSDQPGAAEWTAALELETAEHAKNYPAIRALGLAIGAQAISYEARIFAHQSGEELGIDHSDYDFGLIIERTEQLHRRLWKLARYLCESLEERLSRLYQLDSNRFPASRFNQAVDDLRASIQTLYAQEHESWEVHQQYFALYKDHLADGLEDQAAELHKKLATMAGSITKLYHRHAEFLDSMTDNWRPSSLGGMLERIFGNGVEVEVGKIGNATVIEIGGLGPSRFIRDVIRGL